jgi:chemotaxis protein methyltransferase CheR
VKDTDGSLLLDDFSEREFAFTHHDFLQIAEIMRAETGISLSDVKAPLVYSRLVRRLRHLGMESFRQYCVLVSEQGNPEREQLIAALTTNVTRFFREKHHFTHFSERVLPELLAKARKGARLRFWSAGCSTGEEPYSMALCILALMPDAWSFDIKILATDINKNVLKTAKRGLYSPASLSGIDPKSLHTYFESIDANGQEAWRVGNELARLVSFRELNLISDWPMRHRYHAIFCRNVAIYFEETIRSAFWNRFAALLAPNGVLYIGHSERIADARQRFQCEGNTIYRLIAPDTRGEKADAAPPGYSA